MSDSTISLEMENGSSPKQESTFICGVVEGFYGRPWTPEQRKDLFTKLKKWGMNAYLYAPKDDYKHRAYWREVYTVEEGEHLSALIAAAKENGVLFYYALSPGLDITYSSAKEVATLKRKLDQVAEFGCEAFALLFDDILPEMSEADKEVFQSFAHAQVSVTNEVHQHTGCKHFMFCPTQYCSSRAVPDVPNSEYLTTIGSKLERSIDIMWTGPKVISKVISISGIQQLSEVLRRPPVIWDNLHANDYDQKRVFLGPYSGRSPGLIPHLRGVMTNPNCEYECNFVGIHTLGQWSHCTEELGDSGVQKSNDAVLESENEQDVEPSSVPSHVYCPRKALRIALEEWLDEFKKARAMLGSIAKPQVTTTVPVVPAVNAIPVNINFIPPASAALTTVTGITLPPPIPVGSVNQAPNTLTTEVTTPSILQPVLSVPMMNSLAADDKVVVVKNLTHSVKEDGSDEPMESDKASDILEKEDADMVANKEDQEMVVEDESKCDIVFEDLTLLADLFYLPFEHGIQGLALLNEFHWLKMNASLTSQQPGADEILTDAEEWYRRAAKFDAKVRHVENFLHHLVSIPNRSLLYDMYPYIWDIRGVISLLNTYIKWLGYVKLPENYTSYVTGVHTWFAKGWKEAFMSGDQEPWVFRGGLTADLQRLIPVDSPNDLFLYRGPDFPEPHLFFIRPYESHDEPAAYAVCRKTCNDGMELPPEFEEMPNMMPEKLIGAFLAFSPETCFVVYDETDAVVGYGVAVLRADKFHSHLKNVWFPELRSRYSKPEKQSPDDMVSPLEEALIQLHSDLPELPPALLTHHASVIRVGLLTSVTDPSIPKRLMTCVLSALRTFGSFGAFTMVRSTEQYFLSFYNKLGFLEVPNLEVDTRHIFLGRTF
ncbi:unnamed protein product [Darwinula stevensoni]|uniref:protein O-GlcNAcase n=1 Tax=Darwinula stevensoni TaxID=69355 RepID=A0A7R8X0F1_9CRUS|nr:unnamed protein product [Darwinula stevensoni]CAG0881623.1 unnamed protein product [Darwinula stevensoni]